ncbi:hypothetical protein [Nocardia sp. CA-145437]|uniref:hypothetical protein n=1 Tax=Nocardia sp. CA-145437 TaxID=3239980 RepID=UPI003D99E707
MPVAALRWPGPDARPIEWPGPDTRAFARWPGPDEREVLFPPAPKFVLFATAAAVGGGVAAVGLVYVPLTTAAATGGGTAAANGYASVAISASAVGGGVAGALVLGAEIHADSIGGGVAAAVVVPRVLIAAGSVGGGLAAAGIAPPSALTTAAATGGGTAAAGISWTPLTTAAAVGGGTASVAVAVSGLTTAAANGGGTAAADVAVGYRWSDSFNRTDNASLGTDWRVDRNASPKIATNRAQMKTMANGDGRAGNWVSWQGGGGTQAGRFATDNYGVKAQLITPVGNLATDNFTCLVLAVADTFGAGTMCYLVVTTGNGCAIYTQQGLPPASGISSGQSGQTQRAVVATNIAVTDLIEFRRVGNVFTAYRNGSTFGLSWTDSGNLVSSGATNRRWGFVVEGNYPVFNAEYRSPAVDSIEGFDL